MRKSELVDKIIVALINVQSSLEAVPKKGKNPHFGNTYVELEDALAEAVPKLNAQNIFLSQTVDQNCLLTTLLHISGQWIESAVPLVNKKGDDQGQGGSISYTRRYGLLSILGIPTEDDDGNTASVNDYKKPPEVQRGTVPPIPNRAPGADVKPVNVKWSEYVLKTGKTKGQTIKSIGIDGAMRYRSWLEEKGDLKGASKEDYNALVGFQQGCAEANPSKTFRGNVAPPTTDYTEPSWADEPMPEEPF